MALFRVDFAPVVWIAARDGVISQFRGRILELIECRFGSSAELHQAGQVMGFLDMNVRKDKDRVE